VDGCGRVGRVSARVPRCARRGIGGGGRGGGVGPRGRRPSPRGRDGASPRPGLPVANGVNAAAAVRGGRSGRRRRDRAPRGRRPARPVATPPRARSSTRSRRPGDTDARLSAAAGTGGRDWAAAARARPRRPAGNRPRGGAPPPPPPPPLSPPHLLGRHRLGRRLGVHRQLAAILLLDRPQPAAVIRLGPAGLGDRGRDLLDFAHGGGGGGRRGASEGVWASGGVAGVRAARGHCATAGRGGRVKPGRAPRWARVVPGSVRRGRPASGRGGAWLPRAVAAGRRVSVRPSLSCRPAGFSPRIAGAAAWIAGTDTRPGTRARQRGREASAAAARRAAHTPALGLRPLPLP
jgi:hypothetical protein